MTTPREFEQGQAVFDAEGKPGEITQAFFDFDFGDWIYTVSGLGTKASIELTASAPEVVGPPPAEEIDIGTPRDISGYSVPSSGLSRSDVESIVRSFVNLHRIEVTNALRALIDNLTSEVNTLRDSVSGLVIEQVSFEDRRQADQEALEEVEETSLGGFIRNVGGFLLSPFDKIKGALEEYVLSEFRDGLNR